MPANSEKNLKENQKAVRICYVKDTPEIEDALGFEPYVEAIADFLTARDTKPPITLSIEGEWGCGKTSFMNQLKQALENMYLCWDEIAENEVDGNRFKEYLSQNFGIKWVKKAEIKKKDDKTKEIFYGEHTISLELKELKATLVIDDGRTVDYDLKEIKAKKYICFKRERELTVFFNAWRYDKEEELWAAFALHFIHEATQQYKSGPKDHIRLWTKIKLGTKDRIKLWAHHLVDCLISNFRYSTNNSIHPSPKIIPCPRP